MAKKYDYNVGDIIINRAAEQLFLIIGTARSIIKLSLTANGVYLKDFEMSKARFHEQLNSERGNKELQYFKVLK